MAIREWHRGQLVVLWVGSIVAIALAALLGWGLIDEASGPSFCLGPCPEPTPAEGTEQVGRLPADR